MQTKTKTNATPQEVVEFENLLPLAFRVMGKPISPHTSIGDFLHNRTAIPLTLKLALPDT
jgi:hypothetical protein